MVDHSTIEAKSDDPGDAPWALREPAELDEDEINSNPWRLGLVVLAFAAIWFFGGTLSFVVAVGLLISIFLHELGHFMTSRWTGMKATQFFIGMGPRIWSFKRGETEYGARAYPIGAFVRIVGMSNLDPAEEDEADQAYMNKSFPRRLLVITAGSIMHGIIAIVLFFFAFNVLGVQEPIAESGWTVAATNGGPAEDAGITEGDSILSVDGVDATVFTDLVDHLSTRSPGDEVSVTFDDAGTTTTENITLIENTQGRAILCVAPVANEFRTVRLGPSAPFVATKDFVVGTVQGLSGVPAATLASIRNIGSVEEVSAGPTANGCMPSAEAGRLQSIVGIVDIASELNGFTSALALLAGVNIALGLFNMLPLLPLDGGHAAVAVYERLRSRKNKPYHADFNKLVPLTYVVIFFLLSVSLLAVYLDIFRSLTI